MLWGEFRFSSGLPFFVIGGFSRERLEALGFKLDSRVIQREPIGSHDYNCLQMNAFAVVRDSGALPEKYT